MKIYQVVILDNLDSMQQGGLGLDNVKYKALTCLITSFLETYIIRMIGILFVTQTVVKIIHVYKLKSIFFYP